MLPFATTIVGGYSFILISNSAVISGGDDAKHGVTMEVTNDSIVYRVRTRTIDSYNSLCQYGLVPPRILGR